jgi:hypothetical protein
VRATTAMLSLWQREPESRFGAGWFRSMGERSRTTISS